jgi:hypothetical protein
MLEVSVNNQTANSVTFNYDYSKIFLFDNKYRSINIANATGTDVDLSAGQLIGTISATGKGKVLASYSNDGSQYPTGILAENYTVPANSNIDVRICIGGKIAEEKLILDGSDTLDTAVNGRTIRDRIASDTLGIELASASELTAYDNI